MAERNTGGSRGQGRQDRSSGAGARKSAASKPAAKKAAPGSSGSRKPAAGGGVRKASSGGSASKGATGRRSSAQSDSPRADFKRSDSKRSDAKRSDSKWGSENRSTDSRRTSENRSSDAKRSGTRSSDDRRSDKKPYEKKPYEKKPYDKPGKSPSGRKPYEERAQRRAGRPEDGTRRSDREVVERTETQATYDGPALDPEITGQELDRSVLAQLKGLPEKLAARVARHLVAVGMLIEDDPATAYQHALAARARAARVAVVREAVGEAAYAAGEYAEALSELRAARRINGANDYLPVMADCERALGRPEKALALAKNPAVVNLPDSLKAEMTIVEAGARADLGELDGALRTLETAPLRTRSREEWVARLRYAYADLLLRAGRREDAIVWFHRTAGVDGNGVTDAVERAEALERNGD